MRGEITDCSLDLQHGLICFGTRPAELCRRGLTGYQPMKPGLKNLHNFAAQTPPPIESRTERSSVRFSDDREHPLGVEA